MSAWIKNLPVGGSELAMLYHLGDELDRRSGFLADLHDGGIRMFADVFYDDFFIAASLFVAIRTDAESGVSKELAA